MAANTTGNKNLDCIRTNQLCIEILNFSKEKLSKNGVVVSKFFMGDEFEEIKIEAKRNFKKINLNGVYQKTQLLELVRQLKN